MPTILRVGAYRFFFFSGDGVEPIHVHVERENKYAKIWMNPIRLQSAGGFSRIEVSKIIKIVAEHKEVIIEAWNAYFISPN